MATYLSPDAFTASATSAGDVLDIQLERNKAALLLGVLQQRLEAIQRAEKSERDPRAGAARGREKSAIMPAIMALEAALKAPRRST
ncbi:hypothetical protein [Methylosinus sp. Sm6]|uniref:hypothetical protein n=1 Tax=Methylosinus sp. Sm6 TaxID=2866948 RepID=UPI001C995102|nr:hypothetical protein [Methylosinus sp. Sm6]MBY6239862.1 hypothetical protein [Methylosinus sp. Sm6]